MKPGRKLSSFTRQEVSELFTRARAKVRMPGLRILRATATHEYGRVLIVIPRRVGSAPERNLIRRRIRAIFRERKLYLSGYDCIALIGPECKELSYQELMRTFVAIMKPSHAPDSSCLI